METIMHESGLYRTTIDYDNYYEEPYSDGGRKQRPREMADSGILWWILRIPGRLRRGRVLDQGHRLIN